MVQSALKAETRIWSSLSDVASPPELLHLSVIMSPAPKVSLPIGPAPITALFLGIFIGINALTLVVDFCASDVARRELYAAKAQNMNFKAFNLVMLALGLITYSANFVFALIRSSPGKRRISDFFGGIIFFGGVYVAIARLMPLEKVYESGLADEICFWRTISIALQVCLPKEEGCIF